MTDVGVKWALWTTLTPRFASDEVGGEGGSLSWI